MAHVTKPQGGYRLLPINQLCTAWCAYKSQELSWLTFRVFLALQEVAERRKAASLHGARTNSGLWRDTIVSELQSLVRCARTSQVRAALAQLERVGLVGEKDGTIELAARIQHSRQVDAMEDHASRRGTIPVPRRVLRHLASNGSNAVAAYMLGVTIRCCHVRAGGEFKSRGRCSIRFVADLFKLHPRTVKRAAAAIAKLEWVEKEPAWDRWTRRYGPVLRVDTSWRGLDTGSPPRRPANCTGSPPANRKQELLTDPKNQELAVVPTAAGSKCVQTRMQCLNSLSTEELRDSARLTARYRQAVIAGLVDACPASQLRFFAAAQHALRVATRNPCGLFATVVRRGLWRFISQPDEDRALQILRRVGGDGRQRRPSCTPNRPVDGLIMDLVEKVGWPTGRVETASRTTAAMCSKKLANSLSPDMSSSSPMVSRESTTDATFSVKAARKATCSSTVPMFMHNVSISRACHGSDGHGKHEILDLALDGRFGGSSPLRPWLHPEKTVNRAGGNLKVTERSCAA